MHWAPFSSNLLEQALSSPPVSPVLSQDDEPSLPTFVTVPALCICLFVCPPQNYANLIPGATVGVLATDSRNILELIVTAYKVNKQAVVIGNAPAGLCVCVCVQAPVETVI